MDKIKTFLKDFFNTHGELKAKKANPPLFITGCMRSGTTFLVNKLSMHPQLLQVGIELNKVWEYLTGIKITEECEGLTSSDINSDQVYQMSNYFFNAIRSSKGIVRTLMRFKELNKKKTGRLFYDWVDVYPMNKSTHLINKIGFVNGLFPKSKIIFIVRDIYAQSASLKAHFNNNHKKNNIVAEYPDSPTSCWTIHQHSEDTKNKTNCYPGNFQVLPKMWLRLNTLAINQLLEMNDDSYLVVKYENLIENQEHEFQRIFKFLNLKGIYQADVDKISAAKILYKNTTTSGNPLSKWEKQLSDEEKEEIKNCIIENEEEYLRILNFIEEKIKT